MNDRIEAECGVNLHKNSSAADVISAGAGSSLSGRAETGTSTTRKIVRGFSHHGPRVI